MPRIGGHADDTNYVGHWTRGEPWGAVRPVLPQAVFAAGCKSFECAALPDLDEHDVRRLLFELFPEFRKCGWTHENMSLFYIGHPSWRKMWRVERWSE